MTKNKCYRAIEGSDFDKAIKEHQALYPRWKNVLTRVSHLLGEELTGIATVSHTLRLDTQELKKEENRKLFKQDGIIKQNTKAAKKLFNDYKEILKDEGLEQFQDLRDITFMYGTMRMRGQNLERFLDSDGRMYFKADFNMIDNYRNGKAADFLEEITEIEYEEAHLNELKKREERN